MSDEIKTVVKSDSQLNTKEGKRKNETVRCNEEVRPLCCAGERKAH